MPPSVRKISFVTDHKGKRYFLDSCVWLDILAPPGTRKFQQPNLKFFDSVIQYKEPPPPKIIITELLISEVINAYLRTVSLEKYNNENSSNPISKGEFKHRYRPTEHCKSETKSVTSDILDYIATERVEYFNSPKDNHNLMDVFQCMQKESDFNDIRYAQFCECHGLTLVTNDGDFNNIDSELKIVSANPRLETKIEIKR